MSEETTQEVRSVKGKSMYSYIADAWKNPSESYLKELNKERRIAWRREENFVRIDKPTRLDKARNVGYKAKQGYVLVRGRVRKGSFGKRKIKAGRRAKRKGILQITVGKSMQRIAEERAQKRFPNLEVLNSYWVGANGQYEWYEIILVDPAHPVIQADPKINWICYNTQKGRVYRGKTSAGQKGRGMRVKGKGAEKVRPSIRANGRRAK
ncbi:MAG: 50S ribosomal protein L15e [Methanomassiliicoccales archaeon]|uniref:50S ribosomal protein L15e n=1 Tax=Candidatus Methanarcanum hacksteinii TaxID=2911857 RepID=UPI002701A379|nr:50S ribosomal protein L15e [Candidatus Methanomethylophilaceae archaeon]MCI6025142.1 50S ribosomal protein L15e [Methanomassiliicoccales archaeon]MDD7479272.1 50S ribosomal protein L15e [Methanomassiliicoccales archaeon]MDO5837600.1 50S ribosomal protein L15e [Methanomassiliicoccales archaeon]MDY4580557.1 50S ribosomal protein L15e [Candidatus Methanarcanum hacksteinii]